VIAESTTPFAEANIFAELKRYVRFSVEDEDTLRAVAPLITPRTQEIAEQFYLRLQGHADARRVFSGPEQVERLKRTLVVWMSECLTGPWDDGYFERRARIGRVHVRIELSQRYIFGAMNLIRLAFIARVDETDALSEATRQRARAAIHKILDIELAIMLDTHREAFVERVREAEHAQHIALERLLSLATARYDQIVERGEALVVTFDASGRIILFNARCEELTGRDRQTVAGLAFRDVLLSESDRESFDALFATVIGGGSVQYSADVALADGVHTIRWQFSTLPSETPLVCALGLDITESRQLAERARRAERLASLGAMAAGLAHEIRNPLNAAHLQLTLVQRRLTRGTGDVGEIIGATRIVASELERLATLVADFLQFARPKPLTRTSVDLVATVATVTELLRAQSDALGVELTVDAPEALVARVDDEYIKQVLHNVVRNGIEACGAGGHVHVALEVVDKLAILRIRDDGKGLPTEIERLFEPFFTTKPSGTGLGLSIVHRIVTEHGGTIDAATKDGWTTFTIKLPIDA
jgi:PAS domain S-box-containing protein